MEHNDPPQGPPEALGDSSLTHLQKTMLASYAGSSPEFLDQIRNMKLKPAPKPEPSESLGTGRTLESLPPRVREIVVRAMEGMTGNPFADICRVRYAMMLIYRETDFSGEAHLRRSLRWRTGDFPCVSSTKGGGVNAKE